MRELKILFCFFIIFFTLPPKVEVNVQILRRIKTIEDINQATLKINNVRVGINSTQEELSREMAELLVSNIRKVIDEKGKAVIGLPTGKTSKELFKILRSQYKDDPIWEKVILVQIDEYVGAGPDSLQSFQYQLRNELVKYLNLKKFIAINGNAEDIEEERQRYEKELEKVGPIDILVLGIGRNGHIAFNEPEFYSKNWFDVVKLSNETRGINGVNFDKAYTITLLKILESKKILLIASGENKKEIIKKALLGEITSKVPASLLRFHRNVTFLVDKEATCTELFNEAKNILKEQIKSYLKDSQIKVFVSDLDFTLSPIGENLREGVIEKLKLLAQKGIDIAIISGAKFDRIKSQFLDFLPEDFPWQKLHIYTDMAGIGYDFDSQGNPKIAYEVKMLPEQIDKVNEIIEQFKEDFPEDFEKILSSSPEKVTISLTEKTRSLEEYEKLLEFLKEKLKNTGLIINGSGHRQTIDITKADKSYALFNLRDKLQLSWDQILYVGDTFNGKFGNDLPTLIPGIWNFNVGSTYKIPSDIFSLAIKGDLGTEILMQSLLELP